MKQAAALHGLLLGVGYFTLSSATILFTRFDGGVSFIWVANALVLASLLHAPRARWPLLLLGCVAVGTAITAILGVGMKVALILVPFGIGEALAGALLLQRFGLSAISQASLRNVWLFALIVGVIVPATMALGVAAVIPTARGAGYWSNWLHWTLAHGLGTITFAPIFTLLLGGEIGKWVETTTPRHRLGAAGMVTLMVGITVAVFSQSTLPLLFLPMVPMMAAAVSYEFIGAAASTAILAGVGGYLTVRGSGPIQLLHSPTGAQILFLQFYIASCALIALPIAAELRGRRRLFVSLRESEERFRLLAERSIDVVLNLDPDSIIRYVSPSITELTGLMPEDLIGTPASALAPPEDRTSVADAFEGIMALAGRPHSIELCVRTASGADRWCQAYSRAILDEAQRPIGVVCTLRDISEHKRLEQALAAAAHTDMLTGLPNRRAFALALEQFAAATHDGAPPAWLALIDLDNFKSVNDRWGHEAGDRVLRHFADIARATIRPEDVIARFGGEEFALILRGVDGDAMELICERLRIRVMNAVVYAKNGESIRFTMSAGIAIIDDRGADEILRAADQALYDAKHAGRNRLVLAA